MELLSEATGETTGTAVIVGRTVPNSIRNVWNVLLTAEGSEALLGPGAQLGNKGETWQSHDGREGVVRSFHPFEQIRFSWRLNQDCAPSMVAVNLRSEGTDATRIEIQHSNLPESANRERVEDRWSAALERIESECL
ncbi:hypothetical protein GCM10009785_16420 [Brooklawnia cerclae]|uniref:Uncharacterized protein YndB with AHSA1/START domain n=1 Tax=Brooklawnia cerclae TaxID=349934 RepID=A0ABX0SHG7_9ACTN|nr:SRPBCC domain-containing protein [Brooklawnia cerclae]NIH57789.1 uncharacterized protein YndB with AHSA1/START domain [Brooklawnia cerclae]